MTELLHELKNSSCYHRSIQAFGNVSARKKKGKLKVCWTCMHNKKRKFSILMQFSRIRSCKPGVRQPVQPHTFYTRLLVFETVAQPDFPVVNCERLVCKHEYDVKLRRHKQCTPNTNDPHMPLNEPLQ